MKKFISFLLAMFITCLVYAQGNSFNWAKSFGGTNNDYGNLITTDVSGNVYISGTFMGKADFNPGVGSDTLNSATGGNFLMKLDASGNYLWAKNFYFVMKSMKCDASGNLISTGFFQNTVDFDFGPGTFLMSGYATNGYKDIYISKTDASGNFVWAKHVGGNFIDQAFALTLDASGNIYYTGQYGYGADFDPGPGTYSLTTVSGPFTDSDIFVSKLDANGNFIWAKGMGGNSDEKGVSIVVDGAGNVYTTGGYSGTTDFDPGVGYYPMSSVNPSLYDIFVSKLDALGNFVWVKSFSGPNSHQPYAIAIDGANNLYISGVFEGTVDFDPSTAVFNLITTGGSSETFVCKLNNSGNFMWAKNFGGNGYEGSMALDGSANVYTTGLFSGLVDFDPSSGIYNLKHTGIPFFGTPDVFISKLDSSGNFVWAENFGGIDSDAGTSISIDPFGNIYTTGYFTNTGDFDPAGTTYSLSATTAYIDIFIHKMSPCTSIAAPINNTNPINQSICSGNSAVLSVTGTPTVYWYNMNDPTTVLGSGFNFTTASLSSGTHTLFAETSSCTSPYSRTPITVTVNATPTPTITVNSGSICIGKSFTITPSGANSYTFSSGSQIVSPTVTTTYTVTGTGANGCINNFGSVSNVYVQTTIPTITITPNPATVCIGSPITLSATASFVGASWINYGVNPITVTPAATKTYTADANYNLCYVTKTITVNVLPLPIVTIVGSNSVCSSYSVAFSASGANTYTWDTGVQGPNYFDIPINPSAVYVVGKDLNGCMKTEWFNFTKYNTCIWPGDANSDGVADNLDVLELGINYTETGSPRTTISNAWQPYFTSNWAGTISNGKNLNHSDCNGDGTINNDDTLAIYNNYGLTHVFKPTQTNTVNPQLRIVPDQAAVVKGNWGTSSIYLGDASNIINDINGVAFTVNFDNTIIEPNTVWLEYPASFINTANQNLHFRKLDFANGKIYTATTHTINNNVSGNGLIGILHYQIKSSLTTDTVLNLGISQAVHSDVAGTIYPLTAGKSVVTILVNNVGLQETINSNFISMVPNPTEGMLSIKSKTELQKIEVLSITGQVLRSETPSNVSHTLYLDSLANGIYFVNVYQNDRIVKREKIVLNK